MKKCRRLSTPPGEPPSIVCSHPDEAAQAMMKQDAPAGVRDAYAYIAENCPFFSPVVVKCYSWQTITGAILKKVKGTAGLPAHVPSREIPVGQQHGKLPARLYSEFLIDV